MGTPYLWGGTSTKGVDCSGYAKLIYYYGGVIMTRDASAQFKYGEEVSIEKPLESLAPGDLLYFGSARDGKKNITHTGMYIGGGRFIHCTTHLRPVVQISRLEEAHWTGLYRGARRP